MPFPFLPNKRSSQRVQVSFVRNTGVGTPRQCQRGGPASHVGKAALAPDLQDELWQVTWSPSSCSWTLDPHGGGGQGGAGRGTHEDLLQLLFPSSTVSFGHFLELLPPVELVHLVFVSGPTGDVDYS